MSDATAPSPAPSVCGIILAAGAGRRFGGPKALAHSDDGTPWLQRVSGALRAGGCGEVVVVLGASAERARALVAAGDRVVVAREWARGLSASVRGGLDAASGTAATCAVIVPVDIPEVVPEAIARVVAAGRDGLARATYRGAPGHPVVIARGHWESVADSVVADTGAGPYLRRNRAVLVECSDLWSGDDRDRS